MRILKLKYTKTNPEVQLKMFTMDYHTYVNCIFSCILAVYQHHIRNRLFPQNSTQILSTCGGCRRQNESRISLLIGCALRGTVTNRYGRFWTFFSIHRLATNLPMTNAELQFKFLCPSILEKREKHLQQSFKVQNNVALEPVNKILKNLTT